MKPELVLLITQLLMYAETGTSKNVIHLKAPLLAMEKKTYKIGEGNAAEDSGGLQELRNSYF